MRMFLTISYNLIKWNCRKLLPISNYCEDLISGKSNHLLTFYPGL